MADEPEIKVLLTASEIEAAVDRLAGEISADYRGRNPLLVGVLKGAFVFMADLVRRLDFPLEIDFITASSYGSGTTPGDLQLKQAQDKDVAGRDVLIIEDILDTGQAASFILEHVAAGNPASLKLCTLLDKPERRRLPVTADYLGFAVPDRFVVGYGIDWDEKYRNLPDICYLEF